MNKDANIKALDEEYLYIALNPAKITLFRFLLEGYDGIAVMSTLDGRKGLVKLIVPPGQMIFVLKMIESVKDKLGIDSVSSEHPAQD
jgi:hypothetical protein